MVYAVAILLVSSLTSVGLLAIWAATSKTHWFCRTMLFLGAISPVLLIPAYEPFVAFVIQGAVVAAGVQLSRWREARKSGEPFFNSQFSLRTILLTMAPLALLAAVAVRVPELNRYAWQSIILIGLVGGVASFMGWWIVSGQFTNWKVRLLVGSLIVSACSLALVVGDWFVRCIDGISGWPPNTEYLSFQLYGTYGEEDLTLIWLAITVAITLLTAVCSALISYSIGAATLGIGRLRKVSFGVIVLIVAAPAVFAYFVLMNPLPIPAAESPSPNGYDDFLAAGKLMTDQLLINGAAFDSSTASEQELRQANDEVKVALDRVRSGLKLPVEAKIDYSSSTLPIEHIQSFRSLSRGFDAQAKLAIKQGQPEIAVATSCDCIKFGGLMSRGGLMVDDLVGVACTYVGCRSLYEIRELIPAESIAEARSRLKESETIRHPTDVFIHRDHVWSQRSDGWYGHLVHDLAHLVELEYTSQELYVAARARELAVLRLLQLELALQLWRAEEAEWPNELDALIPKYISSIPVDPLSPGGKPIQYIEKGNAYILYSVGLNKIDEQGDPGDDDGFASLDPGTGDLRLDVLFAPEANAPLGSQPSSVDGDGDAEAAEP